jgi:predicted transcriptional regulator
MKVAISLPDPVFAAAEQLAKELRVPRSQLYADAIAQYLERRGAAAVTAKLNAVYAEQESQVPAEFAQAQLSSTNDEAW